MNVYLDMDFLFEFEKLNVDTNKIYQIVKNIFTEYPQINLYINEKIETPLQLEEIKNKSEILNLYLSKGNRVSQIEDIEKSLDKYNFDILFESENMVWFDKAEKMGVLCFTLCNFKDSICEIVNSYHYKIDLSETNFTWELVKLVSPIKKIEIIDNYILADSNGQNIKDNLVPLLKIINKKSIKNLKVDFFTILQRGDQNKEQATILLDKKFYEEFMFLKI